MKHFCETADIFNNWNGSEFFTSLWIPKKERGATYFLSIMCLTKINIFLYFFISWWQIDISIWTEIQYGWKKELVYILHFFHFVYIHLICSVFKCRSLNMYSIVLNAILLLDIISQYLSNMNTRSNNNSNNNK